LENRRIYLQSIVKFSIKYFYLLLLPFLYFAIKLVFFKPFGIIPDYIGNPICDAIEQYQFDSTFKENHQITKPIIALLPGSRMSELKHVLPEMLSICKYYPDYTLVLAGAPHIDDSIYHKYIGSLPVKLIKGHTYDVVKNSHAALVCSGTATLETALLNCPEVVCYKFSSISYEIGKRVIKVKYISLVNLILNKLAIPELIQQELNETNIKRELDLILEGRNREEQLISYKELKEIVGNAGASVRTAELIYKRCSST
jgi:lipid-A-disaccharide synthase